MRTRTPCPRLLRPPFPFAPHIPWCRPCRHSRRLDPYAHADHGSDRIRHHILDALGGGVGKPDNLGSWPRARHICFPLLLGRWRAHVVLKIITNSALLKGEGNPRSDNKSTTARGWQARAGARPIAEIDARPPRGHSVRPSTMTPFAARFSSHAAKSSDVIAKGMCKGPWPSCGGMVPPGKCTVCSVAPR